MESNASAKANIPIISTVKKVLISDQQETMRRISHAIGVKTLKKSSSLMYRRREDQD